MRHLDSGMLVKLYTNEPESQAVQTWATALGEVIRICDLHLAECTTAFRLKQFRDQATEVQTMRAITLLQQDVRSGILRRVAVDWSLAWARCQALSMDHAAETGARTLDLLHVAVALLLDAREFVTTDQRQAAVAQRVGMVVVDPTAHLGRTTG